MSVTPHQDATVKIGDVAEVSTVESLTLSTGCKRTLCSLENKYSRLCKYKETLTNRQRAFDIGMYDSEMSQNPS